MLNRGLLEISRWPGRLVLDDSGQDLIEYALLVGFIGVATAAFFPMDIAPNISSIMSKVSSMLNYAPGV